MKYQHATTSWLVNQTILNLVEYPMLIIIVAPMLEFILLLQTGEAFHQTCILQVETTEQ